MKKSLRFASAALAVALAASCAAPAFAAGGSSFTKSETVYSVMNADGSIQSTTVSESMFTAPLVCQSNRPEHPDQYPEHREQRRVHTGRRKAGVEHR